MTSKRIEICSELEPKSAYTRVHPKKDSSFQIDKRCKKSQIPKALRETFESQKRGHNKSATLKPDEGEIWEDTKLVPERDEGINLGYFCSFHGVKAKNLEGLSGVE